MTAISSLSEFRGIVSSLPVGDSASAQAAQDREPQLTKPGGSLGKLEEVAEWLAAWQGRHPAVVEKVKTVVLAGNHGVTSKGVSAFPSEVTAQMVANFEAGGAAINQLSKLQGADLEVITLDLERPTADFTESPAMTEGECVAALNTGLAAVSEGLDLLCVGEMGIGNTTSAAALCHAVFGGAADDWTGPGTGVEGDALSNKIKVVREGVVAHEAAMTDGAEILRHLGGREIAAIAGAVVGARLKQIPVLLDGFVTGGAAAVLHALDPASLYHCQVGHVSAEPGHIRLLEKLGKEPLLNLGMRLGEGSGAALAINILKAAAACHAGMATFGEAGVSDKD
ncbi:MAG: nicotinate-nucleotide--dimethylbenzimidazole phosphoribosyltransferase [Rhodospirillaceae bacterium]|nr:nicotinate-nucleotide--dimethylbenzimidazole phosphoribosyltransferase [Rhodospirillaceae bacterium]